MIMPFADITKEMTDWVGGKSANLGEVQNRAGLPVPRGFAITTSAFDLFLSRNDLVNEINKRKMNIDVNEPESIETVSQEVQELILAAPVPEELQQAITAGYDNLARQAATIADQPSRPTGILCAAAPSGKTAAIPPLPVSTSPSSTWPRKT